MSSTAYDQAPALREQLGQALRALREGAHLSQSALARRTGIGQSKVSRVEAARLLPSEAELAAWLDATGVVGDRRATLAALRERVATESVVWRRHLRRGLDAIQAEVKAEEAAASRVRSYHPVIVPGLLQAPAYAQAVAEARHGAGHPNVAKWVASVVDRQEVLYEPERRFEFVVGEAALRWRPGPPSVMLAQLGRISALASLRNVTVGILTFDRQVTAWRSHHFTIYERPDGAMVHLELLAGGQNLRDPEDLARFGDAFERLLEAAVTGPDALALLDRVAGDLGG